jgi:hypothetical protein
MEAAVLLPSLDGKGMVTVSHSYQKELCQAIASMSFPCCWHTHHQSSSVNKEIPRQQ